MNYHPKNTKINRPQKENKTHERHKVAHRYHKVACEYRKVAHRYLETDHEHLETAHSYDKVAHRHHEVAHRYLEAAHEHHEAAHGYHKSAEVNKCQSLNKIRKFYFALAANLRLSAFALPLPIFALLTLTPMSLSFSHSAYAASSASNTVNISVDAGCIISASGNTHAGSIAPSTYAQIGGEGSNTTVTIGCNDGNGYTVYAVGYGKDTASGSSGNVDKEGVTSLIGIKTNSSSSVVSDDNYNKIVTGTAQSGDTSNWNFKLSDPIGLTLTSAYTNNSNVPDSSTAVATKKASTDPTGYIDSFKASYYAYISSTQPADTYSGKVKYTVFHNAELIYNYKITYNLNEGQGGPDPNPQEDKSNTGSVKISGTEPTKEGFEFVGWCTVEPTGNNTQEPTCNDGTTYEAGQDFLLTEINTDITLNAMWKQSIPPAVNKGNLGSMQSFNCSSSLPNIHEYGTVTDSRDNNTYKVAKLMDGKCWMIDNLKIVGRSISSSNSDMTSGSFSIPSSNLSTFKNGSSSNVNNSAAYVDSTYGGYYTWYTATAGTGNSSITSDGVNATSSICPKGWKLPTGGSSSEFNDLVTAYGGNNSTGSAALRATPVPGFTYAGFVENYGGALDSQGSGGLYLSSTSYDSAYAYNLYLRSYAAGTANFNNRVRGDSVRCVARN